jgi:hypothetical protein
MAKAEQREEVEKHWHRVIDGILFSLFKSLCSGDSGQFACPNLEGDHNGTLYLFNHKVFLSSGEIKELESEDRPLRHEAFSLRIRNEVTGTRLVIHARLHSEFFTLLFAVDFSRHLSEQELTSEPPDIFKVRSEFEALQNLVAERCRESKGPHRSDLSGSEQNIMSGSRNSIEEGFKRWVEKICSTAFPRDSYLSQQPFNECGGVFAESFGYIFGLRLKDEPSPQESLLERTHRRQKDDHTPVSLTTLVKGTDLKRAPLAVIDAMLPLLKWRDPSTMDMEERLGKSEYSASLLQTGDALYLSSLGRLMPRLSEEPVVYCLVATYPSKRRLGRLVDQINTLETLRLAALRDLAEINAADEAMDSLRARLTTVGVNDSTRRDFAGLDSRFEIGLIDRVEHARSYIASFEQLSESMHIEEAEGFPKYDELVQARLSDTYDDIGSVGERYEELRKHMAFLLDAEQQKAVLDQTKAMRKHTEATTALLRTAEYLSVAPITYYIGKMLRDLGGDIFRLLHQQPTGQLANAYPYFMVSLALALSIVIWLEKTRAKGGAVPH